MGQETVWTLTIDASPAISSIEELDAAFASIDEAIAASSEAVAGIGGVVEEVVAGIGGIVDEATTAADALSAMGMSSDAIAGIGGVVEDVVVGIGGVTEAADAASTALNEMGVSAEAMSSEAVAGIGGVEESASGLSSLFSGFPNMLSGVGEGFAGMFGSIGEGISGAMGGISNFIGGIGGLADGVFMGAMKFQMFAQMAEQAGTALLSPAENAETMQTAFTTLLGSTKAATDEMEKLDAFASKTPFQTMDIDHAAAQLIGFGINAKDVVPDLTAIGDALSAVGRGSSANLDQIVNIFGKIQLGGKLTVGEMQQFSHDGVNAWAILEQQTGKTQAQLQQMISAGLMPADVAIKDLTQGIEKNPLYAGGMAKQSATMSGLLSTLKSNWDQMLASFASPLLKDLEPMVANLGNALASPGFKNFAAGVGKAISDTFQNIGKFVQTDVMPAVDAVVKGLESPGFKQFATGVGKAISEVFKDIGGFVKNDVTPAISGFIKFLESPSFASFSKSVLGIAGDIGKVLGPALSLGKTIFEGLWSIIEKIWPPIANQLMPAVKHLADVIAPLVAGIITWIEKSGILQTIFNVIGNVLGFVISVIAGVIDAIATVIGWFENWGNTSKKVGGFFSDLWKHIQDIFGGIGKWFEDRFNDVKNGLKTAWDAIVNTVKSAVGRLVDAFMAPIRGIVAGFEWLYNHNYYFKNLVDTVNNVVKAGLAFLKGLWDGAIKWLTDLWNGVTKIATDLWNNVSNAVHNGWSKAIGFVSDVWNKISSFFTNAWNTYIAGPLHTLWTNVSGVFSSAWNTYIAGPIGSLWTSLSTTVSGWATSAFDWGKNLIQGIIDGINSMLTAVGNAASGIAQKIASFLGFHSPTKEGPGSEADQWAPAFMAMFINGIEASQNRLKQVLASTAGILSSGLNTQLSASIQPQLNAALTATPPSFSSSSSGGLLGGAGLQQTNALLAALLASQQQRQTLSSPANNTLGAVTQNFGNINVNGVNDLQSLQNALNQIAGQQFQYSQRGAVFNY